jgi:leader peptidase (prepilin peptidase)/N-methyltransferase
VVASLVTLLAGSPALFAVAAGLVGLAVGSFLNVVIHRLPLVLDRQWRAQAAELEGRQSAAESEPYNLVRPRSRCPACQAPIRAAHNIPVLSWILLRGRCAACRAPISPRYPIVELATGLAFAAVAWHFGFGPSAFLGCLYTAYLIALAGIDIDRQLLPDILTIPLLWIGLIASLWLGAADAPPPAALPAAVIGAAAGYVFLWLVFHLFRLATGKEGMGYGDFKLFAAIGAWLGWQMLPLVLLFAALVGAASGIAMIAARRLGRAVPIPFGPYLAGAAWVAMLWGPVIVERYLRFAGLG